MVEHNNKMVKDRLTCYKSQVSEKRLEQISKSQDGYIAVTDQYKKDVATDKPGAKRKFPEQAYRCDVEKLTDIINELLTHKRRLFQTNLNIKLPQPKKGANEGLDEKATGANEQIQNIQVRSSSLTVVLYR